MYARAPPTRRAIGITTQAAINGRRPPRLGLPLEPDAPRHGRGEPRRGQPPARAGGRRLWALLLWAALCAHGAAVAEPSRVGRARGAWPTRRDESRARGGATNAGGGGAGSADQGGRPAAQSEGVSRRGALGAAGRHARHGSGGQAAGFSRRRRQIAGDRGGDGARDSQPPLRLCLRRGSRCAARRARGARRGGRGGVGCSGALARRRGPLWRDAGQRHRGAARPPRDASHGGSARGTPRNDGNTRRCAGRLERMAACHALRERRCAQGWGAD